MSTVKVVLVEDNPDLSDELCFHLERQGFEVAAFSQGVALSRWLERHTPDVALLDIGLPGEDGLSIARRLRQAYPGLGIAMLTARGGVEDRIAGFQGGADIYLVKPVDFRELAAVVHSLWRRARQPEPPARPDTWQLDLQTSTLYPPQGERILLTPTEFQLMKSLMAAAPEPVRRGELAAAIGHPEFDYDFRRLETLMSRLRRKIEQTLPDLPCPLRSARNVGYAFAAPLRDWQA
ncbi:response regulator transcription factor [Ideonella livida]|uniref:Response regulator transcription factor n=1 Tax=Ideonella livida TaxID=2707176 RepID=A0A7C9PEN2_9BURK|nr:response regulator transcription factor [Ideonella livida]NDY89570.1 response regulator transcription factor [Ideonella livida]